jgi:N-acetylneuraminic acid mutarotase
LYTDTLIIVAVPSGATTGKISINIGGTTTVSAQDFVILPGTWVRKKDNAAQNFDVRANGIAFSVGNKGYYGMGYNGGTTLKDLASYDAGSDIWKRLSDGGLDFQSGIVMVINNKVYTGLGQAFSLNPSIMKQIWEYDPSSDTWTRKKDFPGTARWAAIGISLGDKGYVGLGDPGGGSILRDWWEYDPAMDTWTQKKDNPSLKSLQWSAGFTVNGRLFVGISAYLQSNEWYEYIPSTDNWVRRADFPGRIIFSPASFVIGNKGYIAGGGEECWAYDPATDSWTQQAFIRNIISGSAFVLNNKGYFLPGVGGGGSTNSNYWNKEVWEFTPGN